MNTTLYVLLVVLLVGVVLAKGVVDMAGVGDTVVSMTGVLVSAVLAGAFVAFLVVLGGLSVAVLPGLVLVLLMGASWGWVELPFTVAETIVGFMIAGAVVGLPVVAIVLAVVLTVVLVV